jgi:hypothetical protein
MLIYVSHHQNFEFDKTVTEDRQTNKSLLIEEYGSREPCLKRRTDLKLGGAQYWYGGGNSSRATERLSLLKLRRNKFLLLNKKSFVDQANPAKAFSSKRLFCQMQIWGSATKY